MIKVNKENRIYSFGEHGENITYAKSGDIIQFETMDCFSNQIMNEEDELQGIDWDRVNPATGPVYIEEAEAGDVLKVEILDIKLNDQGVLACGEDLGVLGSTLTGMTKKIVPITGNEIIFNDRISIPVDPMIGVIGVSPADAEINCGTPGHHGGNMDNKEIKKNTTMYFPVFKKGAYLAMGDLHAAMGDGEIGVSGIEVAAKVDVKVEVMKGFKLENPLLETEAGYYTIASHESIEDAIFMAASDMKDLVMDKTDLSDTDAIMLMSSVGNVEICQVVDPLKTVRLFMPKNLIGKI